MIAVATILLIAGAAFFKAVADTLVHHYDTSVFKWKNPKWWKPDVSYKYVGFIRFTKYRPDAWHLANSMTIVCFCAAIVLHENLLHWAIELLIAGALFNGVFNLFYNRILRK